jgi:hypothetical protein
MRIFSRESKQAMRFYTGWVNRNIVRRTPKSIDVRFVARELAALGHDVKQVPPAYAKPFRQGHKNDFRDAYAVAEAVQRPTTRFVWLTTSD